MQVHNYIELLNTEIGWSLYFVAEGLKSDCNDGCRKGLPTIPSLYIRVDNTSSYKYSNSCY